MINELGLAIGRQTLETLGHRDAMTFELLDLEWEKHAEVFGGEDFMAPTAYFTACLPLGEGTSFLEMGCGVGVTAVVAAMRGCDPVTAADINPAAVRNAEANARRHGVGDRVRGVAGDLFDALGADEKYDVIFWNSPFIEAPAGELDSYSYDEYAVFDPGYRMHRTFLRDAPKHLTADGRVFLGFSAATGNLDLLQELAGEYGMKATIFQQQVFDVPHGDVGKGPAFAAHADGDGMLRLDLTLLEFVRS